MKILETIERFGEACNGTTVDREYDVTVKLNTPKSEPRVILRAAGTNSEKAMKYAASAIIVASGMLIAKVIKSSK